MKRYLISCLLLLPVLGLTAACVRHRPVNNDCIWPAGGSQEQSATWRQLFDEAEHAEDLAIRYADTHHGLHTKYYEGRAQYERSRDQCMATLFQAIARERHVTTSEVQSALGQRRPLLDAAVMLSFALLYAGAALLVIRRLRQLYPTNSDIGAPLLMLGFVSLIAGAAGLMVGEEWTGLWETVRVGNGHMSYRGARIPWVHHRMSIFVAGVALFWIVALVGRGRRQVEPIHRAGLSPLAEINS